MPLFALSLVFQICFAIHCAKTGRDSRWLYFIILFPMVGCTVYFVVEVLPTLGHTKAVRDANRKFKDTFDPHRNLRKHSFELEISQNIDNAINLADECVHRGLFDQAIELYSGARKGLYLHDPKLLLGEANAWFRKGEFGQCRSRLEELQQHNPGFQSQDGHLLYARAIEGLGLTDEALHEYAALAEYYSGPEAKYRYALLLKSCGRNGEARRMLEDILRTAELSPRHYSKLHKEWLELSRRELKSLAVLH